MRNPMLRSKGEDLTYKSWGQSSNSRPRACLKNLMLRSNRYKWTYKRWSSRGLLDPCLGFCFITSSQAWQNTTTRQHERKPCIYTPYFREALSLCTVS
jgi:hypothetical protein